MILPSYNVELTKVHYYDVEESGKNIRISVISRDEPRKCDEKKRAVIKKNIFGHKWVLKINESGGEENLKRSKIKLCVYILVSACIVVAMCFGIYLSIESKFFKKTSKKYPENVPILKNDALNLSLLTNYSDIHDRKKEQIVENVTLGEEAKENTTTPTNPYCSCDREREICLKIAENETPRCRKIRDRKDPTGCGGLCEINREYCKLLDKKVALFQCRTVQNRLNCSEDNFNCGNRCIAIRMRCDGILQCSDGSDETNCDCNLNTHFQCGKATGCLERWKKCDGRLDCWDNSDEINCNRVYCVNGQVPCHNGQQCIDRRHFCDGTYHCFDKSDEPKGCELL